MRKRISSSMKPPTGGNTPKGTFIIGRDQRSCKFSPGATTCAQGTEERKRQAGCSSNKPRKSECGRSCRSRRRLPKPPRSAGSGSPRAVKRQIRAPRSQSRPQRA
ncbi:hypothetical protein BRADI_2g40476v3 [Brachypodium distachyon]|uniref:Uncharacterized protein n=1 Tax=Brachypodium distachyon TaxID=15368 RepID=A0A2K2DCZ5_BRADI|nr:hypothetical protein BRADI_2g40476v3 [Brachypodium distachyon]